MCNYPAKSTKDNLEIDLVPVSLFSPFTWITTKLWDLLLCSLQSVIPILLCKCPSFIQFQASSVLFISFCNKSGTYVDPFDATLISKLKK